MKEIKVGIIGCGYWGPNLVRNFNDSIHTEVRYACDLVRERIDQIRLRYPHINFTQKYQDILKDSSVDAVAIATPVSTHHGIVRDALEAGKHVFVEKPLTSSMREGERLVNLAAKRGLVLFVDHIFIYTSAIRKIKEYLADGKIGEMFYFDSVRINLGLFQRDINVIWDLAPHDLATMDYLVDELPVSIVATGTSHTPSRLEDVAYITLKFKGDLIAHFHVNWMSPVKIRRITIGGSKKMLVYDDLDPAEKIKVYDKGIIISGTDKPSLYRSMIQYRIGDMFAPSIDNTEALKTAVDHFADCIRNKRQPITDGVAGLRVVKMLEAASRSLKKGGVRVPV
ncbi:MAG: Gfo/Idh/MocA family oxidoreductase [Nitrospirota bacterium]